MRPLLRLAALSVLLLNACYPAGDGKAPPLDELYFPTGVALEGFGLGEKGAPKFLYVGNSDFDLQYRSASLLSYDLDALRKVVPQFCRASADCESPKICDAPNVDGIPTDDPTRVPSYYCVDPLTTAPCGTVGARDEADLVLHPGRCQSVDPIHPQNGTDKLLFDAVGIGAFATDVIWRANPDPDATNRSRLFVPVRGDSTLHWIDVDSDGKFHCGQNDSEDDDGCDSLHRAGDPVDGTNYALTQPSEPYAVDATADGEFIAITNQTSSSVSLFHNDWRPDAGPTLVSILGSLPFGPVAIAALPEPKFANGAQQAPGFLVAYRTASQVDLLRVRSDEADTGTSAAPYNRYALRKGGSVPINANSLGFDSRGIAIDDTLRQADYDACYGSGDCSGATPDPAQCQACLRAVHQPSVYVASRAPSSLLVGAMTADVGYPSGTSELPSFADPVSLTFGPSRVILGEVKVPGTATSPTDDAGPYEFERRVFVVCFDSRRIFVYDPKRRVIDAIVSTGRGPYALAVDRVRSLAYLGHFTDSYLGVISLDQRFPQTYATIVASIGAPKAPRSSK